MTTRQPPASRFTDLHQAQALAVAKYKLLSTIPLQQNQFIADLTYAGNGIIGISVKSTSVPKGFDPSFSYFLKKKHDSTVVTKIISCDGDYLGFGDSWQSFSHGVVDALFKVYGGIRKITEGRQYREEDKLVLKQVWPSVENKSDRNGDYIAQGIVVTRSGKLLICLWNNRIGERSLGKVISSYGPFEIFTDKNQPLFICPTYIAENGNGDICVSDVGAVVVTDNGGMLRFRYQGISASANNNFEPYGLCCNSACNIIIADMKNDQIHVIDKDGGFLYTVQYEGIKMPRALCIDEKDTVYVGEWNTDSIKVLSCRK
uniref:Uncharacterized protein LOC111114752 n=1 Tax=Crassostrea virginica TaxID=6565 RepID=A0A8B8BZV4_CRAVI|nr:uncharacterized protein LOC111114752 [Crassostrea virginica]